MIFHSVLLISEKSEQLGKAITSIGNIHPVWQMINNSLSKSVREQHGYTMKAEWNSCAPQLPWGQVLQPTTTEIYFK